MLFVFSLFADLGASQSYVNGEFDNGGKNFTRTPAILGPLANDSSLPRSRTNCSDVTSARSKACWAELNLTGCVQEWINNTVCSPSEGFASCFLRQNGFPAYHCSSICTGACPALQRNSDNFDARAFYVAINVQGQFIRLIWVSDLRYT